ncbi:MAG: WG repeat-containing protein [Bacteroidota bacterium]|nr:WG repeat-containing protein [Bacteroidota bacterium]
MKNKTQILTIILFFAITFAEAQMPELIPYCKGNLWGYCDSAGLIKIQVQYDYAELFQDNSYRILSNKNNKSAYFNTAIVSLPDIDRYDIISFTGKLIEKT